MNPKEKLSEANRLSLGIIIALLALLLLIGGWIIPYKFESFSILYKFGMEKTYLRSGKVIGITVALLLFFQVVLATRFRIFEQVFFVKRLPSLHRFNGMTIAVLVLSHPLLIKASENFTPYTFEKKYYPEFLGMGVLAILLLLSFTAIFRKFLKMSYGKWLVMHRLGATLVLLLMPFHILFVSETFKSGLPRKAALVIFSLNFLMIMLIWIQRFFKNNR